MVDSNTQGYATRVAADDPRYRERVAVPVMAAVDALPVAYRALVHEYGYVDVYRAWRRHMTPEQIVSRVNSMGIFVL